MKIVLDTNALVRFFTNDIPQQADKVEKVLGQKSLYIPDVVFPELEYVLKEGYNWSRAELVISYRFLLAKKNIHVSSTMDIAVAIYQNSNLDMADCIIAASSMKGKLASFDKELLKAPGVNPLW